MPAAPTTSSSEARPAPGSRAAIKLGDDDTYYFRPVWSPDGKRIVYNNSRGELWYADVASGKTTQGRY